MKKDKNLIPKQTGNLENNEIHETIQSDFLKNVSDVLLQARKNAKTAVNLSMVYAYYEIGKMIVEEEQHGVQIANPSGQLGHIWRTPQDLIGGHSEPN